MSGDITNLQKRMNNAKTNEKSNLETEEDILKFSSKYLNVDNCIKIFANKGVIKVYLEYSIPNEGVTQVHIASMSQVKNGITPRELASILKNYINEQKNENRTKEQEGKFNNLKQMLEEKGCIITQQGQTAFKSNSLEIVNLNADRDVIDYLSLKEQIIIDRIKEIVKKKYTFEISEWDELEKIIDQLEGFIPRYKMSPFMYPWFSRDKDEFFTDLISEKDRIPEEKYTKDEIVTVMQYFKSRKKFFEEVRGAEYESKKLDAYSDPRLNDLKNGIEFIELINAETLSKEQMEQNPSFQKISQMNTNTLYKKLVNEIITERKMKELEQNETITNEENEK